MRLTLPAIAGTALIPLPYESSLCSMWRIAWRNSLKSSQIKALCSSRGGYPAKDCTKNLDWIDEAKFRMVSGWSLPSAFERRFVDALRGDHEVWICQTLRFCPLCLELGYHSFLQQLTGVERCPLHDIPLTIHCQECGKRMPEFRHSPAVYDHPYFCKCGNPCSGVAPNLALDDVLRGLAVDIEREYGAIMNWWEDSVNSRAESARYWNPPAAAENQMGNWCDVRAFIRSLSLTDVHVPACFQSPRYGKIMKIGWRVSFASDVDNLNTFQSKRNHQERVQTPTAVYRCMLRKLQRWVMRHECWSEEQFAKSAVLQSIQIKDYAPRLLALLCLRTQFESRMWEDHPWDPRTAQLRDEPALDIVQLGKRTPRLAWRAAFLGLYVTWYCRILKARELKITDLGFYHRAEKANVLLWNERRNVDDVSWWVGCVSFPMVDDLQSLCLSREQRSQCTLPKDADLIFDADKASKQQDGPSWRDDPRYTTTLIGDMEDDSSDDSISDYVKSLGTPASQTIIVDEAGAVNTMGVQHTCKEYKFELERFSCWCLVQHNKSPAQMTKLECSGYADFLARPEPREFWMGEEGRRVCGIQWHPFRGLLLVSSIRRALKVVNGYYRFLAGSRSIHNWPQLSVPPMPQRDWAANIGRTLSSAAWQFLSLRLTALPSTIKNSRLEFTCHMLYYTGMRLSELVQAQTCDLRILQPDNANLTVPEHFVWCLRIRNTRGGVRTIELPVSTITLLSKHLVLRGRTEKLDLLVDKAIPLLAPTLRHTRGAGLKKNMESGFAPEPVIRREMKAFLVKCALDVADTNPEMADELRNVRPGSLRNAHLSDDLGSGMSLYDVGMQAGLTGFDRVNDFKKLDIWTSPSMKDNIREMEKLSFYVGTNKHNEE